MDKLIEHRNALIVLLNESAEDLKGYPYDELEEYQRSLGWVIGDLDKLIEATEKWKEQLSVKTKLRE